MLLDYNPTQGMVADDRAYNTQQVLPPLNRWIQSYWQLKVPKGRFLYHSVPDNCVDWIINPDCFDDNFIIPPLISSSLFHIQGPASFFGIRFRILGHNSLISVPLGEWSMAASVKAEDLLPSDIVYAVFESIEKEKCFEERCNNLSLVMLSAIRFADTDPRLALFIKYCYRNLNVNLPGSRGDEFGVSERQLRRLTKQHLGLLPKDFNRVLKFQCTLKAINSPQYNKVYLDHYYDQPHFVREFKRLSGVTPAQFQSMSVLYNQTDPE